MDDDDDDALTMSELADGAAAALLSALDFRRRVNALEEAIETLSSRRDGAS